MSKVENGGPAFPAAEVWDRDLQDFTGKQSQGMTLRDYFAAKAIPAAWDAYDKGYCGTEDDRINVEIVAEAAYSIADAILTARGQL